MTALSISMVCKQNGLSTSAVIGWLVSEGYVLDYKTATEKGLQSGISIATGSDGGTWLVYDKRMQTLIKNSTGAKTANIPTQYTLTDLAKKAGITRTTLVEWLTQERYILTKNAITSKGEDLGLSTKQTPYTTNIYGSEKTAQFLSEESKAGRITIKEIQTKKKTEKTIFTQNPVELSPETFVILDTETTGFSNSDEVIELGILSGTGEELYNSLFCPTVPVSSDAAEVTGITTEMLKDSPKFKDEWAKILELIKGKVLIGHNVKFDKRLIQATVNRYGIDYSLEENHEFVDSMAIAKQELPGENSYKLQNLCQSLGIEGIQTHRAVDDCKMTLQMLQVLNKKKTNSYTI